MNSRVVGWTSFGALWASILGAPVEWLKNVLVFHPNTTVDVSPADYGLPYEEVWFGGTDGRTLHGWYVPGSGEALFIWFHGNGGNIVHRLDHLRLLYDRVGGSHLLFDYQGYGKSRGSPTIPGILADGRDAVELVQARGWATGKRLVYFGESLGAAVGIALAGDLPADRLILLAPFYSLYAMGRLVLPPLAFLVEDELNSARLIQHLRIPLLIIHGTEDEVVPFRQGQELYTIAQPPKVFHSVPGGGHANLHVVGGRAYFTVIRDFVMNPTP